VIPLAAETSSWVALGLAAAALAGSLFATWYTALREGGRTQYADETERNAAFQMAKRNVYAEFISMTRLCLKAPVSAELRTKYLDSYALVLTHGRPALLEALKEFVDADGPAESLDWERFVGVLRDDID
jgi:hypothetical protein